MLINAVSVPNYTFTEINIDTILSMFVIGILLILVTLVFYLIKLIKRGTPSNMVTNSVPLNTKNTSEQSQSVHMNDTELVAVVTAALMAYLGESVSHDELVVRSIRQIGKRQPSSNYGFHS